MNILTGLLSAGSYQEGELVSEWSLLTMTATLKVTVYRTFPLVVAKITVLTLMILIHQSKRERVIMRENRRSPFT